MSLEYRKNRITELAEAWKMEKVNDYYVAKKINEKHLNDLKHSVKLVVSKALDIKFSDEEEFMFQVQKNKSNRTNITPNGAVVPKREYQLEYNLFIRAWCELIRGLSKDKPNLSCSARLRCIYIPIEAPKP